MQPGGGAGPGDAVGGAPLHGAVQDGVLHAQVPGQRAGHQHDGHRAPPAVRPADQVQRRVGDGQGQQRVGGQQEAGRGVPDEEQVREGRRDRAGQGHQGARGASGADRDDEAQHGEQRQGEPPQHHHRVGHRRGARTAQGASDEAAHLVGDGDVPAQAALDAGALREALGEAAVADVRLDDPLGRARREARHQRGQEPRAAGHGGEDEQGRRHPHRVGGPHPRHERGARHHAPRGGPVGAVGAPPQEAADADQRAERDPQVRHDLRAVEERHPQGGEQRPGAGQDAGREEAAPLAQRQVEDQPGQQGEVDPQQGGGRRPGRHRGGQQGHAAGARGAEGGRRGLGADLADVHGLVPAEAQSRSHQQQLGEGEGTGDGREQRVVPGLPGRAGERPRLAPPHSGEQGIHAVDHRPTFASARRGVTGPRGPEG